MALHDEGHDDIDISVLEDRKDDNRCLDALAYLSDWNLEDHDCQTLLDHLEGVTSNGGREDDDNWTVEIALAACIGQCGAPEFLVPQLLTLCVRSIDRWDEFTAMA